MARRNPPTDLLQQIHDLAERGSVTLERRAQIDVENLGYDHCDVCDCLEDITEHDYRQSIPANFNPEIEFHEFATRFETDDLYVKVCVTSNVLQVYSFKLQGSPR